MRSRNDYNLHTYRFHNPNPKGIICLFHGMAGSSNDATHIALKFFENGYAVIAMDQQCHGKSEGPKGTIVTLEDYAKDSELFLIKAQQEYPENTPIFILGHSMGGAVCAMVSLISPDLLKGMILLAPALGVNPEFEPFFRKLARCLNCCCGCLKVTKVDSSLSTRNPDYLKYFEENPDFFNGRFNIRTAVIILD